jgi:hypothetical protein
MSGLHQRRVHRHYVEGCFGCRISTVHVNSSPVVKDLDRREAVLAQDLPAYKRLRSEGIQPPHVAGSARSEAESLTKAEIENPRLRLLPGDAKPYAAEATRVATEAPAAMKRFADG